MTQKELLNSSVLCESVLFKKANWKKKLWRRRTSPVSTQKFTPAQQVRYSTISPPDWQEGIIAWLHRPLVTVTTKHPVAAEAHMQPWQRGRQTVTCKSGFESGLLLPWWWLGESATDTNMQTHTVHHLLLIGPNLAWLVMTESAVDLSCQSHFFHLHPCAKWATSRRGYTTLIE